MLQTKLHLEIWCDACREWHQQNMNDLTDFDIFNYIHYAKEEGWKYRLTV